MKDIQVTARLKIHEGKLPQFRKIAALCIQSVHKKDTRTIRYDWFINNDQTECVVREHYQDSDAVMEHMANLGDLLGQLRSTADMSLEVYGNLSDALLAATEGLDMKTYIPLFE